jgi:hypothetical protein
VSIIIAHRSGWMVCDSRCTNGAGQIMPAPVKKVIRSQDALIGVAGILYDLQQLEKIAKTCTVTELPEAVSQYMKSEDDNCSYAIIVTSDRKLIACGSDATIIEFTEVDYWANGGCEDMCMGYMMHAQDSGVEITPEFAESMIKRVAKTYAGIDDRCQRYFL